MGADLEAAVQGLYPVGLVAVALAALLLVRRTRHMALWAALLLCGFLVVGSLVELLELRAAGGSCSRGVLLQRGGRLLMLSGLLGLMVRALRR